MSATDAIEVEFSSDELTAMIGCIVNARQKFLMRADESAELGRIEDRLHDALRELGYESKLKSSARREETR